MWKTTIKNNKSQPISMVVLDQVPVSTLEEIEVTVQSLSGGNMILKPVKSNGISNWLLQLQRRWN